MQLWIALLIVLSLSACERASTSLVQRSLAMAPTIRPGQLVEIQSIPLLGPKRRDIVAAHIPVGSNTLSILRIAGLPGETIRITKTGVIVNGKLLSDFSKDIYGSPANVSMESLYGMDKEFSIPSDHCFLLGDNPAEALDSRFWGSVSIYALQGIVRIPEVAK